MTGPRPVDMNVAAIMAVDAVIRPKRGGDMVGIGTHTKLARPEG